MSMKATSSSDEESITCSSSLASSSNNSIEDWEKEEDEDENETINNREWLFVNEYFNPYYKPKPKGTIEDRRLEESGLRYLVYLPPGYNNNTQNDELLPVLYHFHGATERFAAVKRGVAYTALQYEKCKKNIAIIAPYDKTEWSWFIDGCVSDILTTIHDELIPFLEETYLSDIISTERSHRFVQGFCTGGFGAVVHGLKHRDMFSKIIVWDGAVVTDYRTIQKYTSGIPLSRAQFGALEYNNSENKEEITVTDKREGKNYYLSFPESSLPYDHKTLVKPVFETIAQKYNDENNAWMSETEAQKFDNQWNLSTLIKEAADDGDLNDTSILMYSRTKSNSSGFLSRCSKQFYRAYKKFGGTNIRHVQTSKIHSYKLQINAHGKEAVNFLFD